MCIKQLTTIKLTETARSILNLSAVYNPFIFAYSELAEII